jgi:hypothetical protein
MSDEEAMEAAGGRNYPALVAAFETMGPLAEWQLSPPATDRKGFRLAVENMRPGYAWAEGEHAGYALHCALCRSAGLNPLLPGVAPVLGEYLGLSRQGYHRLIRQGEIVAIARAAVRAGLYVILRPPKEEGKEMRWAIGDVPVEVQP